MGHIRSITRPKNGSLLRYRNQLVTGIAMRPASDPVVIPVTLLLSGLGAGIGALLGTLVRERAGIYEVP